MATRNRDVRLGVEIQTTGEEALRKAAAEIRSFARDGGEAAVQFNALAAELDQLASAASSAAGLRTINEELERAGAVSREAAAAADVLTRQYAEQRSELDRLRAEQSQAAESVRQAKIAMAQASGEVKVFSTGVTKATRDSEAYQARLRELAAAAADAKTQLAAKTAELSRLAAPLKAAEQAERRLAEQSLAASNAARAAAGAVRERSAALEQAQAAALAAGISTENLAEAEERIAVSARAAAEAANRLAAEQRDAAIAADEGAASMRELEKAAAAAESELLRFVKAEQAAEQAARESAAAIERRRAASVEQAEADRQAALQARGLADAQERGRAAAQSELAAIKESEAFIRRYTQAKEEAIARTREFIAQSGDAVQKAFGAAGLRSVQAIDSEIDEVNRSMSVLQREFLAGRISVLDFDRAMAGAAVRIATLNREIQTIPGSAGRIQQLADGVNNLVTRFGSLTAAVATIGFAAKPIIDATIALEQMRRVLTTVGGSAEQAEQQIEFLRETSRRSGQQFDQLGQSYAKFAASALQSGLTLKDTQDVFESVALAAGNLGLSSDQTKRALEALSQIASKGVVSMEELRQQLGDALPGVLPLLATQLGLTQAELNKLVESGQLLASEAIPAIGIALTKLGPGRGEVEGLIATWNRFINVLKQAGTTIVEGPFGAAAGALLASFAGALRDVLFVAVAASEAIEVLGKTLGATAAAIADGTLFTKQYREEIDRIAIDSAKDLESFKNTAYSTVEATKELAKAGEAVGGSFAKVALEQQKSIDAAELRTRTSEKLAQAVEIEAKSVEQNVIALLEEREAIELSLSVAERVQRAREAVAEAADEEAAALRAARREAVAEAEARGQTLKQIEAYLKALDEKIQKAEADAEKTRAQAAAAREATDAARLAARTFGDQSKQLEVLTGEVEKARKELDFTTLAFKAGEAGAKDLERAEKNLATAKRALRDAVSDLNTALGQQLDLLRSESAVKEASLKLDLERIKIARAEAELKGREYQARQLALRQQELEIALTKTGTALKRDEIKAQLDALSAEEAALRSSGQLTREKETEIRTRRNNLIAQTLETEATAVNTTQQEKNLAAVKNGTAGRDENSSTLGKNTREVDGNTTSLRANARAAEEAAVAVNKYGERLNQLAGSLSTVKGIEVGKGIQGGPATSVLGETGSSGFSADYQVPVPPGYYYTLDPYDPNIERRAGTDPLGNPYPGYFAKNPTAPGTGGTTYNSAFGGYAGSSQQRTDQAAASKTVRVEIVLPNGKSAGVDVPEQSADAFMRELEQAQGTGG